MDQTSHNELEVVVGGGIGGEREISESLGNAGFVVRAAPVRIQWPRDRYVLHRGRYVRARGDPSVMDDPFGEGGKVITGTEFVLVSDKAHVHTPIKNHLPEDWNYDDLKRVIRTLGEERFPDVYTRPLRGTSTAAWATRTSTCSACT